MQHDIPIGKAFCFEGNIQRIVEERPAVNGDKNLFAGFIVIGIDISFQPGLDPAIFIVINPGALGVELITALEAIDIEVSHI
jgi:hypothetical protein